MLGTLVPYEVTLAFVVGTPFAFFAREASDVPVAFESAELHPTGLSSLAAGVAFKNPGGVFWTGVLVLQLGVRCGEGGRGEGFLALPLDGVIESKSGSLHFSFVPTLLHAVGLFFPDFQNVFDGFPDAASFLNEDALDNEVAFVVGGLAVGCNGRLVAEKP